MSSLKILSTESLPITDDRGDKIQLAGVANDYTIGTSSITRFDNDAIFNSSTNDLIAVVPGNKNLNLFDPDRFIFV